MIVGRLAPSPTGALHLGNARTFLIAWLSARRQGGRVILRMEDIDRERVRPHFVAQQQRDLEWLGLDWDIGPIFQSERLELYAAALQRFRETEQIYPCTCTRSDILAAASAPHAGDEGLTYPGSCSHRSATTAESLGKPIAWRWRVRHSPAWRDIFCGESAVDLTQHGGDFVVWRSVGGPAYQLAVVVDDAEMGVTEVIRGDDLIPSTPRQLLLYAALKRPAPQFGHVPLVLSRTGKRLAKRDADTHLAALQANGVSASHVIGHLAYSCGWLERPEPVTARELIPLYRPETIPSEAVTLSLG